MPEPLEDWQQLVTRYGGGRHLLENLAAGGWANPSPIQRQAIPALVGGRDVLGIAPTGEARLVKGGGGGVKWALYTSNGHLLAWPLEPVT